MAEQNQSEVARLLKQIRDEYEVAALGVQGLAATARHEFVRVRMQRIEQPFQQLTKELGSQGEAIALVADAIHDISLSIKQGASQSVQETAPTDQTS